MSSSPCMRCRRVKNPRQCDNKQCARWRRWFVKKWDDMRTAPRLAAERQPRAQEGVCIGGQYYALPHRVHSYLEKDPCQGCLCPRDLCVIPCRVKRSWEQARQDVFL